MADYEKVIKGLKCCLGSNDCDIEPEEDCPYKGLCLCAMALHIDVLALLEEQTWHMLTEDDDGIIHGLPGDDVQYLMTDGKDIWIDDYVDGVDDGIILDSGRDIREITAWMYMPELPKKDRR